MQIVQCSWCLGNLRCSLMYFWFNFGFFCFTFDLSLASCQTLLNVSILIVTWHFLCICWATSIPLNIVALIHTLFCASKSTCGLPLLKVQRLDNLFFLVYRKCLWVICNSFFTSLVELIAYNFIKIELLRSILILKKYFLRYTIIIE